MITKLLQQHASKCFIFTLIFTLIVRFVFANNFPFIGDEAYFVMLGRNPQLGFYEHTPLIAWILNVLLYFGDGKILMRLPSIICPAFIALGIYALGKHYDSDKAKLVSILFLITPFNFLAVLIANDTVLAIFTFLSCVFLFLAVKQHDRIVYYLLSGVCFGLAFFSKYLAVLLGLAYVVYFFMAEKKAKRTLGFLLLFLSASPFFLINLYWNYTHDWANIIFNVYNRNAEIKSHWYNSLVYLFITFYLITPPVVYYLYKKHKQLFKIYPKEFNLFVVCCLFPLLFFLILSFFHAIGLHWPVAFIPFVFLSALLCLNQQQIIYCIQFNVWFAGVQVIALAVLLLLPFGVWQHVISKERYPLFVYALKHQKIQTDFAPFSNKFIVMASSYGKASLMGFDGHHYTPVFGIHTIYGREFDSQTNFRKFNGKNLLVFTLSKPDMIDYTPYFQKTELKHLKKYGANFYYVLGYRFNFEIYRYNILQRILLAYWTPPTFLPRKIKYFCSKYFADFSNYDAVGCDLNKL